MQQKLADEEQYRILRRQNQSPSTYWRNNVHTFDEVVEFYELFHPQYPKELCLALAHRMR
ncbi:hypothetical protein KDA23_05580 [Candidatus Saccharibacteria bacterium]|nr:hypothetical protein [Candidatus Saccharibacteria bacterium]